MNWNSPVLTALVGGLLLALAAYLFAGRYSMHGNNFLYDRFTGEVQICYNTGCEPLPLDSEVHPEADISRIADPAALMSTQPKSQTAA